MCSSIHGSQEGSSTDVGGRASSHASVNGTVTVRRSVPSTRASNGDMRTATPSSSGGDDKIKNVIVKRRRTIYVFYFMAFLDLLAVSLFLPLLNSKMRELGATPVMTGLVSSAYGAIQLISSPVVGWGSDIYGQKLILAICLVLSSCAYILQGLAFNIAVMLAARVLSGIFKHTQTVGKSIVSELSSRDKSYVIGNFNAFGSMGFILGPTLGAHIAQLENGFQLVCFCCAGAFILNTLLLILLVPEPSSLSPKSPQSSPKKSDKDSTGKSTASIFKNADCYSVILLTVRFLFSFATLVFRENLTIVLLEKYNSSVVNSGYLTSLQALMSTVMGFAVGPVNAFVYRGNSFYMVLVSGILKVAVLLTLFWSPSFWLAGSMLVAVSALNPFLRVGVTAVSLEGHQNEVGTILGLSQSATSLARMFSPTAAGIAISMSTDGPFLLAAVSAFCGTIATLIAQRFQRREGRDVHPKSE